MHFSEAFQKDTTQKNSQLKWQKYRNKIIYFFPYSRKKILPQNCGSIFLLSAKRN